jgi:hypothetical protein
MSTQQGTTAWKEEEKKSRFREEKKLPFNLISRQSIETM